MDHGKSVCKWFAAIRGAADGAVEDLTAVFEPNDTQKRKADILLRQFLGEAGGADPQKGTAAGAGVARRRAAAVAG